MESLLAYLKDSDSVILLVIQKAVYLVSDLVLQMAHWLAYPLDSDLVILLVIQKAIHLEGKLASA
jgi:hypothetical protein